MASNETFKNFLSEADRKKLLEVKQQLKKNPEKAEPTKAGEGESTSTEENVSKSAPEKKPISYTKPKTKPRIHEREIRQEVPPPPYALSKRRRVAHAEPNTEEDASKTNTRYSAEPDVQADRDSGQWTKPDNEVVAPLHQTTAESLDDDDLGRGFTIKNRPDKDSGVKPDTKNELARLIAEQRADAASDQIPERAEEDKLLAEEELREDFGNFTKIEKEMNRNDKGRVVDHTLLEEVNSETERLQKKRDDLSKQKFGEKRYEVGDLADPLLVAAINNLVKERPDYQSKLWRLTNLIDEKPEPKMQFKNGRGMTIKLLPSEITASITKEKQNHGDQIASHLSKKEEEFEQQEQARTDEAKHGLFSLSMKNRRDIANLKPLDLQHEYQRIKDQYENGEYKGNADIELQLRKLKGEINRRNNVLLTADGSLVYTGKQTSNGAWKMTNVDARNDKITVQNNATKKTYTIDSSYFTEAGFDNDRFKKYVLEQETSKTTDEEISSPPSSLSPDTTERETVEPEPASAEKDTGDTEEKIEEVAEEKTASTETTTSVETTEQPERPEKKNPQNLSAAELEKYVSEWEKYNTWRKNNKK